MYFAVVPSFYLCSEHFSKVPVPAQEADPTESLIFETISKNIQLPEQFPKLALCNSKNTRTRKKVGMDRH